MISSKLCLAVRVIFYCLQFITWCKSKSPKSRSSKLFYGHKTFSNPVLLDILIQLIYCFVQCLNAGISCSESSSSI